MEKLILLKNVSVYELIQKILQGNILDNFEKEKLSNKEKNSLTNNKKQTHIFNKKQTHIFNKKQTHFIKRTNDKIIYCEKIIGHALFPLMMSSHL